MTTHNDPANYRRLSEPFASPDDAEKALDQFLDELMELRNKHRIRDMAYVLSVPVAYPAGEADCIITGHFGSSAQRLPLMAYGHAEAVAEHENQLAEIQAKAKQMARKP